MVLTGLFAERLSMKYITRIAAIRQCKVDCIMSTELRFRTS